MLKGKLAGQKLALYFPKEEQAKDKKPSQRRPAAHLGGLWGLWFLKEPRDFSLLCFNALQRKRREARRNGEKQCVSANTPKAPAFLSGKHHFEVCSRNPPTPPPAGHRPISMPGAECGEPAGHRRVCAHVAVPARATWLPKTKQRRAAVERTELSSPGRTASTFSSSRNRFSSSFFLFSSSFALGDVRHSFSPEARLHTKPA